MRFGVEPPGHSRQICPSGFQAGMHDPGLGAVTRRREMHQHRTGSQPGHELVDAGCGKECPEGCGRLGPDSRKGEEGVYLVVSQKRTPAYVRPESQSRQRVGSPVDQISEAPQLVPARIEPDQREEFLELPGTTLNVSYDPAHDTSPATTARCNTLN